MALEQTGVLIKKLPIESGVSVTTGRPWEKQEFIIEQGDKYKNYISFSLFGEKTGLISRISEGETVKVEFYIGSQKPSASGKYYNNVNAVNVDVVLDNGNESISTKSQSNQFASDDSDLPF